MIGSGSSASLVKLSISGQVTRYSSMKIGLSNTLIMEENMGRMTLNEPGIHDRVVDLIPVGKNNAISMRSLSSLLRIDSRVLRQIVQELRLSGHVICSCQYGYFRPSENITDVFKFYRYYRQRAKTNLRSLRATEAYLRKNGFLIEEEQEEMHNAEL